VGYKYWLDAYDSSWQSRRVTSCSGRSSAKRCTASNPSLFEKRSKVEKSKEDFCFISSLTDEQLETEILATEAEVYGGLFREELKPYLNALYAEWERRVEDESEEDNLR